MKAHSKIGVSLVACTALAAPIAAHAGTITYDFTGTVDSATGVYSGAGSIITGSFTLDFSAANPSQSGGTVGSSTGTWSALAYGGGAYDLATPGALVFASSLSSGAVSYGPPGAPSSNGSDSFIVGGVQGSGYYWQSGDVEFSSPATDSYTYSEVQLLGGSEGIAASAPFGSNGLPLLGNASSQDNYLQEFSGTAMIGSLDYTITSLTPAPVPLPATAWLLLSALGGFGWLVRRR
jgi:PEP-CTERM motif-containing protein